MTVELLSPLRWCLTCTLLIGAVTLLRLLLDGKLPRTIWPLLWWLVLLRLLLPFSLPCSVSVQNVWPTAAPPPTNATADYYADYGDGVYPPGEIYNNNYGATGATVTQITGEPQTAIGQLNIWLIIWAAGAGIGAVCFSLVYWRSRRRFRLAEPLTNPEIQQWLNQHQLRRPIAVRQSAEITSPLTYGLLRPVILLPGSMNATTSALHFALLHEWTHIRRFDSAAKLLAAAALCLHWFNPAVWLFFRLFSRDIELACDECVVRYYGGTLQARRDYALALLNWAETRLQNPLYNGFGGAPENDKNVITERIVAIMNAKKVSYISLAIAGLLIIFTATAFATNAPDSKPEETVNVNDIMDFDTYAYTSADLSDEELHQLFSAQSKNHWATTLSPYEPFGLTWQFDDPDMDGNGLKMYYQGREVRGIYDEPNGAWITEHMGNGDFAPDAVELYTVYTDGQLSGLRFANDEEQAQWDETRRHPARQEIAEFEPFGLTYNDENRLVYNGQLVRYFWDGYEIWEDDKLIGRAIHFEYTNLANGEIDLRTRRGSIYNGDGSIDSYGELLGLEVYVEPNIADMQNPPDQRVTYAVHSGDSLIEQGQTISERMNEYARFGLEYREQITSNGTKGDIYFNDELVAAFVDKQPGGGAFSTQSYSWQEGADDVVLTEYDEQGQLVGLRLASREEADQYLEWYRPQSVGFYPGYDENNEPTLYYSYDYGRTKQAIAKN